MSQYPFDESTPLVGAGAVDSVDPVGTRLLTTYSQFHQFQLPLSQCLIADSR
jgi:hypothetical protein